MRRRNSHMTQGWQTKGRKAGCSKGHHSPPHEKGRIRTEITYVKIRTGRAWRQNELSPPPLHNNESYKIHGCWARFWADYHARRAVWWETITYGSGGSVVWPHQLQLHNYKILYYLSQLVIILRSQPRCLTRHD